MRKLSIAFGSIKLLLLLLVASCVFMHPAFAQDSCPNDPNCDAVIRSLRVFGGNVGIGTTDQVVNILETAGRIRVRGYTVDGIGLGGGVFFTSAANPTENASFVGRHYNSDNFTGFWTAADAAWRLVVTDDGKVGIGTQRPAYTLDVSSGSRLKLGLERSGGGQLILANNPNDNSIYLEGYNSSGGGSAAEVLITGADGTNLPAFSVRANQINLAGNVGVSGGFTATGPKCALVETASYGKRQLYAVESPENWFEDVGSAKLVDGHAVIKLDPIFAETVNTKNEYHVFLTPKGECEGLYVANQTTTAFEVRELKKGKGNLAFDYRIVAKRKGYERVRLAEVKEIKEPQAKEVALAESFK